VGTASVTVTVPLVAPAPVALLTATENVALACPWMKLPAWLLAMLSTGGATMVVASPATAVPEPPPETPAWFVTLPGALAATFTATAIAG
jgi:hypothetical protein